MLKKRQLVQLLHLLVLFCLAFLGTPQRSGKEKQSNPGFLSWVVVTVRFTEIFTEKTLTGTSSV